MQLGPPARNSQEKVQSPAGSASDEIRDETAIQAAPAVFPHRVAEHVVQRHAEAVFRRVGVGKLEPHLDQVERVHHQRRYRSRAETGDGVVLSLAWDQSRIRLCRLGLPCHAEPFHCHCSSLEMMRKCPRSCRDRQQTTVFKSRSQVRQ